MNKYEEYNIDSIEKAQVLVGKYFGGMCEQLNLMLKCFEEDVLSNPEMSRKFSISTESIDKKPKMIINVYESDYGLMDINYKHSDNSFSTKIWDEDVEVEITIRGRE